MQWTFHVLNTICSLMPTLAGLGVTRAVNLGSAIVAGIPSLLPTEAKTQLQASLRWRAHWASLRDEVDAWDATMAQMRQAMSDPHLRDLPLVVLTAPDNPGMAEMREPWLELQRELAGISDRSTHHVIEGAGHISLATEAPHVECVVDAIRDIIGMVG